MPPWRRCPTMRRRITCSDRCCSSSMTPAAGVEQLTRAIALDPSLVEARVTLAQALARAGRRAEAREQQDAVQRVNDEKAALGRAMLLVDTATDVLKRARPADAVPLLREAVALAPAFAEAHFQLAIALKQGEAGHSSRTAAAVRGGQSDEVDAELRRAVELEPSHAPAYVELGLRRASRREITSGIEALRHAVTLAPGLVAAQRPLADSRDATRGLADRGGRFGSGARVGA